MTVKTIEVPEQIHDEYHQIIDRSMAFLDEYLGTVEWVNDIDLEALDLEISSECICGQLFDMDTGYRVVEDMDTTDGYSYALKYVIERGVPDEVVKNLKERSTGEHVYESLTAEYLGFSLDDDKYNTMIAKHNGYRGWVDMITDTDVVDYPSPWQMLTDTWIERIEKRKAELGTMA